MSEALRCGQCGRKTVYHRLYSGEKLCGSCFSSSIIEKVKRTIAKYRLLKHKDIIAVAVSGGKDSLSLLQILSQICSGHSSEIYGVTIDEGVSGYREEAVDLAEKVTSQVGVKHIVLSFDELYGFTLDEALKRRGEKKISACSICGVFRRRALDVAAEKIGANVVATAHNLDDFLQTFFINMLNGDLSRLKWLDPELEPNNGFTIRRIKPLIEMYEEELAFYAFLNDIPFQSVSCPYMDEGIRSEVRSMFNALEAKHPGIKYSTLATVMGIVQNLRVPAEKSVKRCMVCGSISTGDICSVCKTLQLLKINR